MGVVTYQSMALKAANKRGRMKKDSEGYVDIIGGAFNSSNAHGDFYSMEGVTKLLEHGSIAARRMGNSQLYSELGHPQQGNLSLTAYKKRLLQISEKHQCNHIKKITLDTELWKTTKGLERGSVATILKVKPYGPYAHVIDTAINTPSINLAYSIRSFVRNGFSNGRIHKKVLDIVTYDNVGSQGMPTANKYSSPSTESIIELDVDSYELLELADEYNANGNESMHLDITNLISKIKHIEREGLEDSSLDLIEVSSSPIWLGF